MPNANSPSGIYKITNTVNGKCYIGSAVNFHSRKSGHRRSLIKGTHHSAYLQSAWNKYGEQAFVFELVELVHEKDGLIAAEQRWMDADLPAYNICRAAGSPLGVKHTQETRSKISASNKGRVKSAEAKANMKAACVGRRLPPRSEAGKISFSQKMTGRKRSLEAIQKTADAKRGEKWSDESRAKLSAARKGEKRGPFSDEHKANLSKALTGRQPSEEARANMSASAKLRPAPVLSAEAHARGSEKRRGAKRTEEQKANMRAGIQRRREAEWAIA